MAIDTIHSKGSYRHSKMCLKNLIEFVGEDVFKYKYVMGKDEICASTWLLRFYKKVYFLVITGVNN